MPFLHTSNVGIISNEYILEFSMWLILLLTCKLTVASSRYKVILYTILLMSVGLFSLLIHTRALTMLIALALVYLGYGILYRDKKIVGIICLLPVIYFWSQKVIIAYQKLMFGANGGGVRNATVTVSHNFSLFDTKTWDVWFHMITGMINTEIIITGGLFLVVIVTILYYIVQLLYKKERNLTVQGNMILATMILCIGATIAAFLVSAWFEGMLSTWGEKEAAKQYAYKGLTYVRYWNIYVPPLVMCVLTILIKRSYKQIINISIVLLVALYGIFLSKILPIVKYNSNCASFMYGIGHYNEPFQASEEYYIRCILISLIAILSAYHMMQTKYKKYTMFIFIIYMMRFHYLEQTEYNFVMKEKISSKVLASYDLKCDLEDKGVVVGTYYLNDETTGNDNNWKIYSVAQFYFNKYRLEMELPRELTENDIIISVGKSDKIETKYKNINCYVLDDNEVWYTHLNLDK